VGDADELGTRIPVSKRQNYGNLGFVNWTSTTVPMWQIDCENFRKVGSTFQLKDVTTEEHRTFVKLFCVRYDFSVTMAGTTAIFSKIDPSYQPTTGNTPKV
jgi:hypothetical protein